MRAALPLLLLALLVPVGCGPSGTADATIVALGRSRVQLSSLDAPGVDVVTLELEVLGSGNRFLLGQVRNGDSGLQPPVGREGQQIPFDELQEAFTDGAPTNLVLHISAPTPTEVQRIEVALFPPDVSLLGPDYIGFTVIEYELDVMTAVMTPSSDTIDLDVEILLIGRLGP